MQKKTIGTIRAEQCFVFSSQSTFCTGIYILARLNAASCYRSSCLHAIGPMHMSFKSTIRSYCAVTVDIIFDEATIRDVVELKPDIFWFSSGCDEGTNDEVCLLQQQQRV